MTWEHHCTECKFVTYSDSPRSPVVCPECGEVMAHYYDGEDDDDGGK